ncbi:MAG: DUF4115 domain-containing protein [Pseudomonadales bacterium]|nr:DUF4115 domain-containing protein [Pseudomonadales bacterium]
MSEDTLGQITPGSTLASAREVGNLTQRDVADALNLSMAVVQAIETGDKDKLPANVFTKGYIRAYAKLLDLDPEPLVAGLAGDDLVNRQSQTRSKPRVAPIQLPPAAFGAAAVCLIVLLVWAVWPSGDTSKEQADGVVDGAPTDFDEDAASQNVAFGSTEQNPATPSAGAETAEETRVDGDETSNGVTEVGADSLDVGNTAAGNVATVVMTSDDDGSESDINGFRTLTAAGDQRLELDFLEECWVEIKDAEGGTLFADLGRPGRTFKFQGEGPFHVLLGYAPGALVSFNEEPVALSPHTRNNVASVVLGQ